MNNQSMRVSTIGSSQTVADELFRVTTLYFGHKVQMQDKYHIKKLPVTLDDDLYIVLPTRVEEASKYVARDKIFPLELVLEETFYVKVARIPSATNVVILIIILPREKQLRNISLNMKWTMFIMKLYLLTSLMRTRLRSVYNLLITS